MAFTSLCGHVIAAHPLVTDDTGTQDSGNHQVEFNTDWLRDNGARNHIAAATYSYGIRPDLDFFVNIPFSLSSPRGVSDVSVGGKWRFWDQAATSIAIKPELFLASGSVDRELGTGRAGMAFMLLATHVAEPWTLHANLGAQLIRYSDPIRDDGSRRTIWRASVAAAYAVSEQAVLVFDTGIARNLERSEKTNPAFAVIGVIYSPQQDIDLDVGLKIGLNRTEANRQSGIGLTIRF
jgi:hypothetical protein